MSNGSKVIALGALEPPKADFSITLRPLKLQISGKVLRPMKVRSKALVLTYPKPFGMKVGGSQIISTDSGGKPFGVLVQLYRVLVQMYLYGPKQYLRNYWSYLAEIWFVVNPAKAPIARKISARSAQ